MWDAAEDVWFTDGPLVLEFDSHQFEIAAFKVHICLSWGTARREASS